MHSPEGELLHDNWLGLQTWRAAPGWERLELVEQRGLLNLGGGPG
jgi:hypothetical protein